MYLHARLRICLLALESRYPEHTLQLNEQILGYLGFCSESWRTQEMLELLEDAAPDLLQEHAHLVIDEQRSEIYLVNRAEHIAALWLHCQGRIPQLTGNINVWRRRLLHARTAEFLGI